METLINMMETDLSTLVHAPSPHGVQLPPALFSTIYTILPLSVAPRAMQRERKREREGKPDDTRYFTCPAGESTMTAHKFEGQMISGQEHIFVPS